MFLLNRKYYLSLDQAIRIAILQHKPMVLKNLSDTHGILPFSKVVSEFSGRLIADTLVMLPMEDRKKIIQKLSRTARYHLELVDKNICIIPSKKKAETYYLKA